MTIIDDSYDIIVISFVEPRYGRPCQAVPIWRTVCGRESEWVLTVRCCDCKTNAVIYLCDEHKLSAEKDQIWHTYTCRIPVLIIDMFVTP
jgi:hypothetical protein